MVKDIDMKVVIRPILAVPVILLALHTVGNCQVDSLRQALTSAGNNTERVEILYQLARLSWHSDLTKTYEYAISAIKLSEEIEYKEGTAKVTNVLGAIKQIQGDNEGALKEYLLSLQLFEQLGDSLNIAKLNNNIGLIYHGIRRYRESILHYNKSMAIYERLNNEPNKANTISNIGLSYLGLGENEEAVNQFSKSLALQLRLGNVLVAAKLYSNLGRAHQNLQNYQVAMAYHQRGYNLIDSLGSTQDLAEVQANMAGIMNITGNYREALRMTNAGINVAREFGLKPVWLALLQEQAIAQEGLEMYKEALQARNEYIALRDSVYNEEINRRVVEQQSKYELEAKGKEIEILNKDKALQEAALGRERNKNYLLLSLVIFAGVLLLVAVYFQVNKTRTNKVLAAQNNEIKNQQTQLEKALAQLKQSNADLNHLNEEKDYLMKIVAHDLKSPLHQIQGLADLLKLEVKDLTEDQAEILQKITGSSGRLVELIDKILDVSAVEAKSINLALQTCKLDELLLKAVGDFEKQAERKEISIRTKVTGATFSSLVDPNYTIQVYENLISNAIKFSPPNQEIVVSMEEDDEKIKTEVIDNGPGLNEEDQQKLFTKGQKLSARPTGGESSTGLGLSIVKKYVEAMKGKVWCESKFGQGAKFVVEFDKA